MDYLSKINGHERDNHITFDEGPHIYTIDGDSDFTSVTKWIHSHFKEFDADQIINRMMNGKNWKESQYFGMSKDEIKLKWEKNRNEAASAGTKMHYDIECYYNKIKFSNKSIEFKYFQNFCNDFNNLKPYRTEWMVWDKELKFAGSIDMVFINDNQELEIYDWKRSKAIKKENKWNKAKTKCISSIQDCNFWHYSLQLNTYRAILEKNYDIKINKMCLICLHPDNDNKNYIRYEVPFMIQEIDDLFKYRKLMLTDKIGVKLNELNEEKKLLLVKLNKYMKFIDNTKKSISYIDNEIDEINKLNPDNNNEALELTNYLYNDKNYLVNEITKKIFSDDGEYIGNWLKDKPIFL